MLVRNAALLAAGLAASVFLGGCGGSGGIVFLSAFNLDFGIAATAVPATYAGASGQDGIWVDCALGVTNGLTDVDGNVTAASITLTGQEDMFNTPTTDTGLMMSDSIVTTVGFPQTAFSATVTGLANGDYRVYYYYHSPTSGYTANGVAMGNLSGAGDANSRDVLGVEGFNWDFVDVTVSGGTLTIVDTTPTSLNGLSAIQIVPL